uniref:1-acylglycerol-3-phosphate O-acyltransferase n=1 Tax=Schistocephalus solidus TaxID=70667 RepID=A0A0X3Q4Q2_SCHSO
MAALTILMHSLTLSFAIIKVFWIYFACPTFLILTLSVALIPVWPRVCTFVAKRSIRFYGPFGLLVWFLKAILIDRKDRMGSIGELQRAAEIIREEQVSVIIFPEGTRGSMGEKLLPFKKGPFHMAISAQVIIFHHLLVL